MPTAVPITYTNAKAKVIFQRLDTFFSLFFTTYNARYLLLANIVEALSAESQRQDTEHNQRCETYYAYYRH